MKKVLIMAGGTGGHIFPALAVAESFKANGIEVYWLGTPNGLESRLVPSDYPMITLPIKALRGKGWVKKITAPFRILSATFKAYCIIRRLKPGVVLGMGGYVSGPGGLAAWLARVPLVIHEQNAVAGLTNRCLSYLARRVLSAYPEAFPHHKKGTVVGNPVRSTLCGLPSPLDRFKRSPGFLRILVLGGSQGAHVINQRMVEALSEASQTISLSVWHQTGVRDFSYVSEAYQGLPLRAKVDAFIENMAEAYAWADLVVCRAGALTVSEVMAVGVASIFIPYPYAVDDHQWYNSRFLEEAGAATILREGELTPAILIAFFKELDQNRSRLLTMADNAHALSKRDATEQVVLVCGQFL